MVWASELADPPTRVRKVVRGADTDTGAVIPCHVLMPPEEFSRTGHCRRFPTPGADPGELVALIRTELLDELPAAGSQRVLEVTR